MSSHRHSSHGRDDRSSYYKQDYHSSSSDHHGGIGGSSSKISSRSIGGGGSSSYTLSSTIGSSRIGSSSMHGGTSSSSKHYGSSYGSSSLIGSSSGGIGSYDDRKYYSSSSSSHHHHSSSSSQHHHQDYKPYSSSSRSHHHGGNERERADIGRSGSSGRSRSDSKSHYYDKNRPVVSSYSSSGSKYDHPPSSSHYNRDYKRTYSSIRSSSGGGSGNTGYHVSSSSSTYAKPSTRPTSTAVIRRIPPPRSPPHSSVVKIQSSISTSSRYRQAPPEDSHRRYEDRRKSYEDKAITRGSMIIRPKKRYADGEGSLDDKIKRKRGVDEEHVEVRMKQEVNDSDKQEDTTAEAEKEDETVKNEKKQLLKLHCIHCDFRCISFKDFSSHTRSPSHTRVMGGVVEGIKKKLVLLKDKIRNQQKSPAESNNETDKLADTTTYCRVCDFNFKTDAKEHEANELHKELKSLLHRKCEICNVEFRIWKVHVFHTVALEHVKRQAIKEAEEQAEAKNFVAGTNMTLDDIGLELTEQKSVIFCRACVRYFPIRDDNYEELRMRHCLSFHHIQLVEEYTNRMKYLAKREAEAKARAEAKEAKALARTTSSKDTEDGDGGTDAVDSTNVNLNIKEEKDDKEREGEAVNEDNEDDVGEEEEQHYDDREEEVGCGTPTSNDEDMIDYDDNSALEIPNKNGVESNERDYGDSQYDDEVDQDEIQLHPDEDESVEALHEDA